MLRKRNILAALIILFFLFQGCAGSSKSSVSRVKAQEGPSGWYWDDSRKALAYGGGGKPTSMGKPPSGKEVPTVREITPPPDLTPKTASPVLQPPSRKDYIRARFPGKKVIFPDEIKVFGKKPEYKVGIDDVLSILVWNHPDLSVPGVIVRRDGMISLPLIGNVKVEGLMIPEIEEALKRELSRFLTRPQVTVNPKEMNSQRVFLVGNFKKPAVSTGPLLPIYLLKGGNTLLEALSDVEFYPESDLMASYVGRGDTMIPVNIKALLMGGDLTQNILLEPGDRIVVPSPLKEINILGEVKTPAKYNVRMDTTFLDALSIAGGVNKEGADMYTAYVARNKQIIPVNLKRLLDFGDMSQNFFMEDRDIIYVPNNDEKKYFVLGEVAKPGVVFYKDPVDVIEAVAQGGGFMTTAQRKQVVVVRGDLRSPQIFEVNMLAMMEGKSFDRFALQKGDIVYVPRTIIADWNVFISQLVPTAAAVALIDMVIKK
jgi:polysaccharide export outer membrane protein